jgi:hypothetical protein
VAGEGTTLLASFNHLATAVRRCAPFLGSWDVVYNEDESAQAFAVSLVFGDDARFEFTQNNGLEHVLSGDDGQKTDPS